MVSNELYFGDTSSSIDKMSVESILSSIKSGIGLDIAKNHSGICIWENGVVKTYGFKLNDYDTSDYFAEYKMRLDFKNKLSEIIKGKSFEFCIVEDVYGGDNFDTTRKLLALNTVIDELIFDGVCKVEHFVRWNATKWLSYFRQISNIGSRFNSKVETQLILEFLDFDFYIKNKNLDQSDKESIFFEDICDATAMLCGMVIKAFSDRSNQEIVVNNNEVSNKNVNVNLKKKSSLKISDIKLIYLEDIEDVYTTRDRRLREEIYDLCKLNTRNIEKSILSLIEENPDSILCSYLPVEKLGYFGIKHKLEFYHSGEGYLFFYKK